MFSRLALRSGNLCVTSLNRAVVRNLSVSSAFKNDEDSSVVKRDTAAEIKKGDPVLLQEWEKGLITHSNLYSDIEFPEVLQERGREPNDARKEGLFKLLLLWGPKGRFFSVLITRLLYSPEEVAKEKDEPLHPFFTDPDIRSPHTLTRYRALNKMYYGKQRDMVNYPTPTTRDGPPPTRGWLFPKSWIDSLEDKVGVMGLCAFPVVGWAGLSSLEILALDPKSSKGIGFFIFFSYIAGFKFGLGRRVRASLEKATDQTNWALVTQNDREQAAAAALIRFSKQMHNAKKIMEILSMHAEQENAKLQLEIRYRERLARVHKEVKTRLDYQLDVQNARMNFEKQHMVNWILTRVNKGITPKLEEETIAQCIADLKVLQAKV